MTTRRGDSVAITNALPDDVTDTRRESFGAALMWVFSQNYRSIKLPNLALDDRRIFKTVAGSANFAKIACLHGPGFGNTYSSTKI